MRVTGNSGAWASPYSMPKSRRTESGAGWGQYLDPEVQKRKLAGLPDSQGWTEENLAFLKEHYAGDLSDYEVYDALETMKRMGAISQKEQNYADGCVMIAFDPSNINGCIFYEDTTDPGFWLGNFHKAPMVNFRSMDDIISWVEEFRTEDHPDAMTRAEAAAWGGI